MITHSIKLDLSFCDAVLSGRKFFEIRRNDRDYQVGDRVRFAPVDGGAPTEHAISRRTYEITYLLTGWGLQDGYVAFAIREV